MSTRSDVERDPVVAGSGGAAPPSASGTHTAEAAGPSASDAREVPIGTLIGDKYRVEPASANAEEPLPSTRPDGCAARRRASTLGSGAPVVLGASEELQAPESNRTLLLLLLGLGGCLGLGVTGFLALSRERSAEAGHIPPTSSPTMTSPPSSVASGAREVHSPLTLLSAQGIAAVHETEAPATATKFDLTKPP